jgi:DMSO/TMAO reductase YedYZ heme-binding membrane subunit
MATAFRSWRLFWSLFAVISVAVCLGLPGVDFHYDRSVEALILRTIVCALPCLVAAFMASSLLRLWPGRFTRWLMSNRRYVGLAFAAGMTWHFAFVGYFFWTFGNRLRARDLTLDLIGLLFLIAMTVTSFAGVRRRMKPANWRGLHKVGIYILWFLPTFFFLDDVLRERDVFDGVAVAVLVGALTIRLAARTSVRRSHTVAQPG